MSLCTYLMQYTHKKFPLDFDLKAEAVLARHFLLGFISLCCFDSMIVSEKG